MPADSVNLQQAVVVFGLGTLMAPPEPVSRAWSNDVFRVRTSRGLYAIKVFPSNLSEKRRAALRVGMSFEAAVLASGTIPMPRPIAVADEPGVWLAELGPGADSRPARCHEWVGGCPPSAPLGVEHVRAAGTYLGTLHAMGCPGGDTSELPPADIPRWKRAARAAAERELVWAGEMAELTPLVERLAGDVEVLRGQCRPMSISHRDFDPKNTVVDDAGRLVIADWDYAGPVLPDAELVIAATSFAGTESGVCEFIGAYQAAGGDAVLPDRLALSMEAADLDWLLRNVEACLQDDAADRREEYATAGDLIASLARDVRTLYRWPERLSTMGIRTPRRHAGR